MRFPAPARIVLRTGLEGIHITNLRMRGGPNPYYDIDYLPVVVETDLMPVVYGGGGIEWQDAAGSVLTTDDVEAQNRLSVRDAPGCSVKFQCGKRVFRIFAAGLLVLQPAVVMRLLRSVTIR